MKIKGLSLWLRLRLLKSEMWIVAFAGDNCLIPYDGADKYLDYLTEYKFQLYGEIDQWCKKMEDEFGPLREEK
jgi:hypothetical protein